MRGRLRPEVLLVSIMMLAGCVTDGSALYSPPPPRIETVQPGDQQLTCDEIRMQMVEMDRYIADGQRANTDMQERGAAGQVTSSAAGFVPIPGFGTLVSLAANPGFNEAGNRMNRAEQAAERKKQLATLFNQKNCT